jgi:hypothetical protein
MKVTHPSLKVCYRVASVVILVRRQNRSRAFWFIHWCTCYSQFLFLFHISLCWIWKEAGDEKITWSEECMNRLASLSVICVKKVSIFEIMHIKLTYKESPLWKVERLGFICLFLWKLILFQFRRSGVIFKGRN